MAMAVAAPSVPLTFLPNELVLVTGANGFVAAHVLQNLLSKGAKVRGTVRSQQSAEKLRNTFPQQAQDGRLEIMLVPEISAEGAFDQALTGVTHVLHMAFPLPSLARQFDPIAEFVDPAIKGTENLFFSLLKAPAVRKLVYTSSGAAVIDDRQGGRVGREREYTEADWNTVTEADVRHFAKSYTQGDSASIFGLYRTCKAVTERKLWDLTAGAGPAIHFAVTTVLPTFVLGVPIDPHDAISGSNAVFWRTLTAPPPADNAKVQAPSPLSRGWVDVRDVAEAHVRCCKSSSSDGQRLIASAAQPTLEDVAKLLIKASLDIPAARLNPKAILEAEQRPGSSSQRDIDTPRMNGSLLEKTLELRYTHFDQTVTDFVRFALDVQQRTRGVDVPPE